RVPRRPRAARPCGRTDRRHPSPHRGWIGAGDAGMLADIPGAGLITVTAVVAGMGSPPSKPSREDHGFHMVLPIFGLRFIYRAMRSRFKPLFAFFTLPIIVSILGCGGGGNDQPAATSARYVPEIHLFALEEFKYRSYNVGTVVDTPILASVAVRAEEPWELGGLGYASAVDDGTVKLVYTCDDADHIRRLCVAVSRDAISFHKPAVKEVYFGDNNDNNILPVSLTDGGCTFKLYDSGYG